MLVRRSNKVLRKNFTKSTGGAYKDGPENIFFGISGRARKFWTVLIGQARQKTKKDMSGPSLYAPAPVHNKEPQGTQILWVLQANIPIICTYYSINISIFSIFINAWLDILSYNFYVDFEILPHANY